MFGKRIKLFKLFGFEVKIDASWLIIALLVSWTLATGVFPHYYPGLKASTYWIMGIFGVIGLFVSIIAHEFFHSFVARRFGLPMHGITLFIFGGVAEMSDEPPNAKTELYMAIAGPVTSVALGFIFYLSQRFGIASGWPQAVTGTLGYLKIINWVLAAFNLVPAFPLDGGRILRAVLWKQKNNLEWATHVSSRIGRLFGGFLIFTGILYILLGAFIGGMWWILIGMFLRGISGASYRRVLMRKTFEGEPVSKFMKEKPVTAPPQATVRELVEDYIYRYHHKMFPVETDNRVTGCVTSDDIKNIPKDEWDKRKVADISKPCSKDNTVGPDTDAMKALSVMSRSGKTRLMVIKDDKLKGIISLRDLLKLFSLKMDIEGSVE